MHELWTIFANSFDNPSFPWGLFSSAIVIVLAYALTRLSGAIAEWYLTRLNGPGQVPDPQRHGRIKRGQTQAMLMATSIRAAVWIISAWLVFSLVVPSTHASLVGASLGLAFAGFAAQPMIHDVITGWHMIASRWYELGDAVTLEPHQWSGVVEDITLRSTTLRAMNGEKIIVHHRHIQAARVARRAVRDIQIEVWVSDADRGREMIERVGTILPEGPVELVRPLRIVATERVTDELTMIRAEAAVPPGREWLLDDLALELMREHDPKGEIIRHGPISRFADDIAERRFSRAVEPVLGPRG